MTPGQGWRNADLIHQLLMEVAVQGRDDRIPFVVPEVQHSLGLQLHDDHYVQRMGIEVVVWGGPHIHKALDVAARLSVAHLLCILVCSTHTFTECCIASAIQ